MASKKLEELQRKSSEGDYTDPAKSKAVDASYSDDYLQRRDTFVQRMKDKVSKRRQGK